MELWSCTCTDPNKAKPLRGLGLSVSFHRAREKEQRAHRPSTELPDLDTANPPCSRQPWSAYAVHLTTLSPPALLGDLLLVWLCHKATSSWGDVIHDRAMHSLYLWMFTSKWIKLLGHYIRYPVDLLLLPISVLFGYFHGAIKMYAVMTLNVVSCNVIFFSLKGLSVLPEPLFSSPPY